MISDRTTETNTLITPDRYDTIEHRTHIETSPTAASTSVEEVQRDGAQDGVDRGGSPVGHMMFLQQIADIQCMNIDQLVSDTKQQGEPIDKEHECKGPAVGDIEEKGFTSRTSTTSREKTYTVSTRVFNFISVI